MGEPAPRPATARHGGGFRPPPGGETGQLPKAPTRDEIRALMAACTGRHALRNRTAIRLAFDAGCRVGELVRMRLQDLAPDGTLTFRRPKIGDEHAVVLQDETVQAINEYLLQRRRRERRTVLEPWGPIFVTDRGGPMSERTFRHACQKAAEAAGLRKFISGGDHPVPLNIARPHGLRHAAGVDLTAQGADPSAIQAHLGHKDPRMTDRYRQMASEWQVQQTRRRPL